MVSFILAQKELRFLLELSHLYLKRKGRLLRVYVYTLMHCFLLMFLSALLMAVDREMSDQIIRMMSYELFLVDLHSMDLEYQYIYFFSMYFHPQRRNKVDRAWSCDCEVSETGAGCLLY